MTRRQVLAGAAAVQLRGAERELLNRVADVYKAAAEAYSVIAIMRSVAGPVMSGTAPPVKRRLQTQNGLCRLEQGMGDQWIFVRGEQESWIYRSDRREYRQGLNASDVGKNVEAIVRQAHEDLGRKFALLSNISGEIKTTREQDVKVAGRKIRCTVVSIKPARGLWTETLWIDPATALVWKSVLNAPESARRPASTKTIEWQQIEIGGSLPSDTFVFAPPKNARRVGVFSNVPMAEPPPLQMPHSNP